MDDTELFQAIEKLPRETSQRDLVELCDAMLRRLSLAEARVLSVQLSPRRALPFR
jgi:hypothetical protein